MSADVDPRGPRCTPAAAAWLDARGGGGLISDTVYKVTWSADINDARTTGHPSTHPSTWPPARACAIG